MRKNVTRFEDKCMEEGNSGEGRFWVQMHKYTFRMEKYLTLANAFNNRKGLLRSWSKPWYSRYKLTTADSLWLVCNSWQLQALAMTAGGTATPPPSWTTNRQCVVTRLLYNLPARPPSKLWCGSTITLNISSWKNSSSNLEQISLSSIVVHKFWHIDLLFMTCVDEFSELKSA